MTDPAMRRLNMVEGQLRTNKVTDPRLIRAMSSLSREAFLPGRLAGVAYLDEDVPLDRTRMLLALAALVMFIICFTPAPIEPIDLIRR